MTDSQETTERRPQDNWRLKPRELWKAIDVNQKWIRLQDHPGNLARLEWDYLIYDEYHRLVWAKDLAARYRAEHWLRQHSNWWEPTRARFGRRKPHRKGRR